MHDLPIEALPDAVLLSTNDRRYVDANAAACDLLDRPRAELIGMHVAEVATPLDEPQFTEFLARGSLSGEATVRKADGRAIRVEYRARANVMPGVHLTIMRERPPTSERVLGDLLEIQASVLADDVRLDDVMERICARAAAMTGAEGATIEMQRGDRMVYRVTTGRMAGFQGFALPIQGSLSGLALTTREVLMCEDSELDPRVDREACRKVGARSMIVVPLTDHAAVVGVLKVTSPRAHAFGPDQVDLLRLIAGFLGSAMVAANAQELRRTLTAREAARLAELERLRDEMTSLVVHDLRSPLTVIMANLEYVRGELPTSNEEAIGAAIDALEATQRLDQLIIALLETARLEQGRFPLRRARFEVRALFAQVATDPRIRLDVEPGLVVHADRELMRRVLAAILENALRFIADDGVIALTATRTHAGVQLRIGNDGPPIELREHAFGKFVHAESSRFGLGLYFCKLVVEAHAGTIAIESTAELPTIFVITLPTTES